jgi:hypothetical protein
VSRRVSSSLSDLERKILLAYSVFLTVLVGVTEELITSSSRSKEDYRIVAKCSDIFNTGDCKKMLLFGFCGKENGNRKLPAFLKEHKDHIYSVWAKGEVPKSVISGNYLKPSTTFVMSLVRVLKRTEETVIDTHSNKEACASAST